jgi:hypothetical protein
MGVKPFQRALEELLQTLMKRMAVRFKISTMQTEGSPHSSHKVYR